MKVLWQAWITSLRRRSLLENRGNLTAGCSNLRKTLLGYGFIPTRQIEETIHP